jgi:hypothetical protein
LPLFLRFLEKGGNSRNINSFALHKLWLSKEPSRQARSRPHDIAQAKAVAAVATAYLKLRFTDRALARLPEELKAGTAALAKAGKDIEM